MNSENADTEPSLQMHKLPSVLFFFFFFFFFGGGGGGGGGGWQTEYTFFGWGEGGGGVGYTLRKGNTVCRP